MNNFNDIKLPDSFTVGRHPDNDVQLDHHLVDNFHVRFRRLDGAHYLVRDISKNNVTMVNRQCVVLAKVDRNRKICLGSEKVSITLAEMETAIIKGRAERYSKSINAELYNLELERHKVYRLGADPTSELYLRSPSLPWHAGQILFKNGWRIVLPKQKRIIELEANQSQHVDRFDFLVDDNNTLRVTKSRRQTLAARRISIRTKAGSTILNDLSLRIESGTFIGIVGPSGAGKSTLMKALCGLTNISSGKVELNNEPVNKNRELRNQLKYVPQSDVVEDNLTVAENIYFACRLRIPKDWPEREVISNVERIINTVGLQDIKDRLGKLISGGQRQRVNLAMEIALEPRYLFADEPCSGLSAGDSSKLMGVFRGLADKGTGVILTIHTPDIESLAMMDYLLVLDTGGYIAYFGPAQPDAIEYFTEKSLSPYHSPKVIFDVLEKCREDEPDKRKVTPEQWSQKYRTTEYFKKYIDIS